MNSCNLTNGNGILQNERRSWENAINSYAGSDPLEIWWGYVCWLEQNLNKPGFNDFLRSVLERCLSIYEKYDIYKQDIRMIKMWMIYINMQANPQNFFQLLYERNVGTQCAVFYIGWANYYISISNFKQAEIIFKKGFHVSAQPFEELQAAYSKFHHTQSSRNIYDESASKKRSATVLDQRHVEYSTQQQQQPPNSHVSPQMQQQNKKIKLDSNYVDNFNGHSNQNEYVNRMPDHQTYQQSYYHHGSTTTSSATIASNYNGSTIREYNNQQTHNDNHIQHHQQHQIHEHHQHPQQQQQQQQQHSQQQQQPQQQQQTHQQSQSQQHTTPNSNQYCNLDNSAYYISSSLNYVYNSEETVSNYHVAETQPQHIEQQQEVVQQEAPHQAHYANNYNAYGDVHNMNGDLNSNLAINLPADFVSEVKNDPNDVWKTPLTLEEPYEPNRKSCYPKHLVYPGNDVEFCLDEIRSRKYKKKIDEVKEKLRVKQFYDAEVIKKRQQQQLYEQQQYYLQQQEQIKKQNEENSRFINQQQQQQQQQQQYVQYSYQSPGQTQQIQTQSPQAHVIQNNQMNGNANYSYNYNVTQDNNVQMQQITNVYDNGQEQQHHHLRIKIKKPKNNIHYNNNLIKTMNDVSDEDEHNFNNEDDEDVDDNDNTLTNNSQDYDDQIVATAINYDNKIIRIKYKKGPQSADASFLETNGETTNGRVKKVPSKSSVKNKVKKNKFKNTDTVYDNNSCNSSDVHDANLLLSITNMKSSSQTPHLSSAATSTATTPKSEPQYLNHDDSSSYSNSEFNTSFSNITFSGSGAGSMTGDNSNSSFYQCGTPNKNNNQYLKTSTPLIKYTKKYMNNNTLTDFTITQNDDSMSSMTSEQNSFFQAEHNEVVKKQRYEKALQTIEQHLSKKEFLDPFNSELCRSFLTKINFPSFDNKQNDYYKIINTNLSKLGKAQVVNLGGTNYSIEKEVGRGAYGAVYRSINFSTGAVVAIKYQKPPNTWELYICSEVRKRIKNPDILPGFMGVCSAVIAPNASVLISEFSQYGSLLDINNRIRTATTKVMHESMVLHFSSQILNIVQHLHSCRIIHADIKPDNFLLMKIPEVDSHVPTIRLIDFGCAIDMDFFGPRKQFKKVIQTDGFTCTEMLEGREWSYQTDLFCVAGTIHVMLFGEYMQLTKKFGSEWDIKQKFPRYLKKHVWSEVFLKLLNVKDLDHLPNIMDLKHLIDGEAYNMESELVKHIRTLSNLLKKR